jgi:hypothetical protein
MKAALEAIMLAAAMLIARLGDAAARSAAAPFAAA